MSEFLPVGCFGKVPCWREYLEQGTHLPTSRALKRWLHEGREETSLHEFDVSVDQPVVPDQDIAARLWYLIGAPSSSELLVGVLRASRDAGGRKFPFSTFTHIPRKIYGKHYDLLPLALLPVWEGLDDAWQILSGAVSKEGFDESLAELQVPHPAPIGQIRGDYKGRQMQQSDRLFDRRDGASYEILQSRLNELKERLRRSKSGAGPTVQLPVSSDLDEACFESSFWIDLVNRQFMLKRFEPSLFIDSAAEEADRVLTLHYGPLMASDYPAMMGLRPGGDSFLRPAHPEPGSGIEPPEIPGSVTYAQMLEHRYR